MPRNFDKLNLIFKTKFKNLRDRNERFLRREQEQTEVHVRWGTEGGRGSSLREQRGAGRGPRGAGLSKDSFHMCGDEKDLSILKAKKSSAEEKRILFIEFQLINSQ